MEAERRDFIIKKFLKDFNPQEPIKQISIVSSETLYSEIKFAVFEMLWGSDGAVPHHLAVFDYKSDALLFSRAFSRDYQADLYLVTFVDQSELDHLYVSLIPQPLPPDVEVSDMPF